MTTTTKTDQTAEEKFAAYSRLQDQELDTNYEIFTKQHLAKLMETHLDKYALMKNGKIVGIFDDSRTAVEEGEKRFEDRVFTAHRINNKPVYMLSQRVVDPQKI